MRNRPFLIPVAVMALLVLCGPAAAEMYKWVDKNGVIQYRDYPPGDADQPAEVVATPPHDGADPASAEEPDGGHAGAGDRAAKPDAPPPAPGRRMKEAPKVEVYGTSWCPYCRKAREFFTSRGIPFDDYDIEKDGDALRRKNALTPDRGVPTTVIDGKVIVGFSEESYEKALEIEE